MKKGDSRLEEMALGEEENLRGRGSLEVTEDLGDGVWDCGPCSAGHLVSICIPTRNAARTVAETIQSVLQQSYSKLEIIVVDNASEDCTLDIITEFSDSRLRVYRNDHNIGAEANFTRCVEMASGDYIAIWHADDVYLPTMVEEQVQVFERNPRIGAVFTLAEYVNADGLPLWRGALPRELRGRGVYVFQEIFTTLLRHGNFLVCPSAMVRKDVYKESIPFDRDRFGMAADLAMWLKILEKHLIAIVENQLLRYRISEAQGTWRVNYLRVEPSDFFRVMEHYLSATEGAVDIPQRVLSRYKVMRVLDLIQRAESRFMRGEIREAQRILSQAGLLRNLGDIVWSLGKPRWVANWIIGMVLLILATLGLGQHLGRPLWWLRYGRKQRRLHT